MTPTALAVAVAGAAAVVTACGQSGPGGGGGGGERLRRDRDAGAAVTLVDRPGGGGGGAAPTELVAEREPNDLAGTAMPLAGARVGVRGELDGETDVDAFALEIASPGTLAIHVTGVADVDLKLELRDPRFAVVVTGDRRPAGGAELLPNAPVERGTYYVVVREVPRKRPAPKATRGKAAVDAAVGRQGPSAPYELTVTHQGVAGAGVEREPNDDPGTATPLALGEPVTGWIGWGGDVDVWKLTLEGLAEGNGLDLAVTAVPDTALTVEVTDAAGRTVVKTTGAAGQPVALTNLAPRLPPGDAAVHFVRVAGKPSSPEEPYTLTVATRLLDLDEEAEPNDRTSQSNPLRFGLEDQGAMRGQAAPGDKDVFALSASPFAAVLDVAVDAPPGVDLALTATTDSGVVLATADRGGVGAGEQLSARVPAGALVYLELAARADKQPRPPGPYRLRWSLTEVGPGAGPGAPPVGGDDPLPPEE